MAKPMPVDRVVMQSATRPVSLRIVVSSAGRLHAFEVAGQFDRLGCLLRLYTAYPKWKVWQVPANKVRTFPWLMPLAMGFNRLGWHSLRDALTWPVADSFDRWVAKHIEPCDVIVALSSFGLRTFRAVRLYSRPVTVCDRGSSHIVYQDELLAEEYALHGAPYRHTDRRIIEKELHEYAEADLITVPSTFAYRSFVEKGVPAEKLAVNPYGVNLSLFRPVPKEDSAFRVLYVGQMSLRKGIPYLLEALASLRLPDFELMLIGLVTEDVVKPFMARHEGGFRYLGPVPKTKLHYYYSQASVFVIASVEEGLATVQPQAMACGLPVVATANTGAEDLFTDGIEGFIVPIRDPMAIRERVLELYQDKQLRDDMSRAALHRVQTLGCWESYGQRALDLYTKRLRQMSE